jgi:hypothetical protein
MTNRVLKQTQTKVQKEIKVITGQAQRVPEG